MKIIKKIVTFIYLFTSFLFAEESGLNLLTIDTMHYNYKATSLTLDTAKLSYRGTAISYLYMDKNYIARASVKYSKKQNIGHTSLNILDISLEQEGWQYEIGLGYKFYLTERLFIGPSLLFVDTYRTVYTSSILATNKVEKHDSDLRFYTLLGYNLTKSTIIFASVELDNDILSNNYEYDYSQYTFATSVYQLVSEQFFLYLKYTKNLRNKQANSISGGNEDYSGYGFGLGIKF